jgi:hypothetical protein
MQNVKVRVTYDWRFTANQFILATSLLGPTTRDASSIELLRQLSLRNIRSDEKMGLPLMNMIRLSSSELA